MEQTTMRYAANLLVVSDDRENNIELCLTGAGYHCKRVSFPDMQALNFDSDVFDLILIDGDNNKGGVDIAAIAKVADENDFPVLLIGKPNIRCRIQTISSGFCDLELLSRVGALIRLENMQQELVRRIETTKSYGIDLTNTSIPSQELGDTSILIVGSKSVILGNILLRLDARAKMQICKNTEEAIPNLRSQQFDAVILSGVGHGDSNLRLANDIRSDSRLFNVPLIMVLENAENREAAYIHGVSDIVLHDTEMDTLINRTTLQILQYRYRFAMQKLFRVSKPHPIADGPTDLYSSGFMQAHLATMFEEHEKRGKVLSVASFKITNLDAVIEAFGYPSGDQLLRQIGSVIFNLVRGEDFCGCHEKGHYAIALPGTREKEAKVALDRILGVIINTEFSVSNNTASIQAEVSFGLAEVDAGETVSSVIRRGFDYVAKDEKAA
jgi:two-component system cell cycle response regulator